MIKYAWLLSLFIFSGCATNSIALKDLDYPFALLRQAVTSVIPGGARVVSENGREYSSDFFPPGQIKSAQKSVSFGNPARTARRRSYASVLILGDRRPYRIEVDVRVEDKIGNTDRYQLIGHDKRLARALSQDIRDYLVKSRDKRDLIDDFRAF